MAGELQHLLSSHQTSSYRIASTSFLSGIGQIKNKLSLSITELSAENIKERTLATGFGLFNTATESGS
jgi:hypothetical protein